MSDAFDDFLTSGKITAITGRPASCQHFIVEDAAFAVAAGMPLFREPTPEDCATATPYPVVVLMDRQTPEEYLQRKFKSWCHARHVDPDEQSNLTGIDVTPLQNEKSYSAALFAELEKRGINPALIVSSLSAAATQGFASVEAQAELGMAKSAAAYLGCGVLIAGHEGARANPADTEALAGTTDTLWQVKLMPGGNGHSVTLTHGNAVIELTGRTIGGNGYERTVIFDLPGVGDSNA